MGTIITFDFQKDLKFQDSYVEQDTALPNNTNYTSDSIDLGKVQGACGLKIIANGAVVIADTKILKIELYDSADDITFAVAETLVDYTNSTGSGVTRADGYVFRDFVPGREIKKFIKIKVTTDSDLSAYAYDAYIYYLAR